MNIYSLMIQIIGFIKCRYNVTANTKNKQYYVLN